MNMKITIECEEDPPRVFVEIAIDLYVKNKIVALNQFKIKINFNILNLYKIDNIMYQYFQMHYELIKII